MRLGASAISSDSQRELGFRRNLRQLYLEQRTQNRKLGLPLEALEVAACEHLTERFAEFGYAWTGFDAYIKGEPTKVSDILLLWEGEVVSEDECKNTSGTYYLSQYVKKPKANHYLLGAVMSSDSTITYLEKFGVGAQILGRQITDWPFFKDGSVKRPYRHLFRAILYNIYSRVVLPRVEVSVDRGISNSASDSSSYPLASNAASPESEGKSSESKSIGDPPPVYIQPETEVSISESCEDGKPSWWNKRRNPSNPHSWTLGRLVKYTRKRREWKKQLEKERAARIRQRNDAFWRSLCR